jgi:hypothetical protein
MSSSSGYPLATLRSCCGGDSLLAGPPARLGDGRAASTFRGDVSLPLSMEALGHAVGGDDDGPATLDASRRGCGVRAG